MSIAQANARRVAVVTGASRGIGAATAILAAARGFSVVVNYNQGAAGADEVVRAIAKAGGRAAAVQADVTQESDVIRLFKRAAAAFGPVTALVNNAGITGRMSRIMDLTTADIESVLRLNVIGSFLCAREAAKQMSTARGGNGGAIVNLSSAAATLGSPGEFIHYAASKGAIDTFTIGLAKELGPEGIRVNAVAPGLIDTEIHARAGDPGRIERLMPTVPLARAGTAQEVAEAIVFLISDASAYINGSILRISGGR